MLPELEAGVSGEWRCAIPADGRLRVGSANETMVSFESIANDALPPLPVPSALNLYCGQEVVARGRFGTLCSKPAFVIEEVL
jgi:hypothetical protein